MWEYCKNLVSAIREHTKELKNMSQALSNLNAAITDLSATVDKAIAAGIGGSTGVPEAEVQAAADNIATLNSKLTAAIPVPPPPTP
jgi:seryl-tRNA synthetase